MHNADVYQHNYNQAWEPVQMTSLIIGYQEKENERPLIGD